MCVYKSCGQRPRQQATYPAPILVLVQECQESSSQSSPGRAPGQQHQLTVQAENNKAAVPRQKISISIYIYIKKV